MQRLYSFRFEIMLLKEECFKEMVKLWSMWFSFKRSSSFVLAKKVEKSEV